MSWLQKLIDIVLGLFKNKTQAPSAPATEAKAPVTAPPPEVVIPAQPLKPVKKKVPTRKEMSALLWQFTNGDAPTRVGPYKLIKETNGKNRSKAIDAINTEQKAYLAAPYCQTGVQEVLDDKCRYYKISRIAVNIPEGPGTQAVWAKTPSKYRRSTPDACCWVSWNHGEGKGHTGEITSIIDDKKFVTLEFNTSAYGQKIERDGEGFYFGLVRDISGYGSTTINGYIDVYQAIVDVMLASGDYEL